MSLWSASLCACVAGSVSYYNVLTGLGQGLGLASDAASLCKRLRRDRRTWHIGYASLGAIVFGDAGPTPMFVSPGR